MTRGLLVVLVAAALGLLDAPEAHAQTDTAGAIQGTVSDARTGAPLAGVTVVVTSPSLQGTQEAMTDAEGQYKITNLAPGIYAATFYYADLTVRRINIEVSVNRTTPVYIKLDQTRAGGEVITVEDKAPSVDPTTTTQGTRLDQDYLKNIPVPGRSFSSALGAAAGSAGDGLGVSFSGSSSLENQYVVDGINTTGLTFGTVGTDLVNEFIEQIEIITGGYQAEYGRATGGVVNVVTKQGSNEFKGSVFSYISPGFLIAERERTPTESASIDAESNLKYNIDFGFDLGGPIVKDKVWFYVGFRPQLVDVSVDKITKRRTDCRETRPDGSLSECNPQLYQDGQADEDPETGFRIFEELDRRRLGAQAQTYQFLSKINYAAAPEHQGQMTIIATPASGETLAVNGEPAAVGRDFTSVTTDLSGKWTSKFNNNKTEVEGVLGWHRDSFVSDSIDDRANTLPRQNILEGNLATLGRRGYESLKTVQGCTDSMTAGDPYPGIENCPFEDTQAYAIGGPGAIFDEEENRYSGKLTGLHRIKGLGNHEIKAGIDLEDNNLDSRREISGDALYNVFLSPFNQTQVLRWVQLAPRDATDGRFDQVCGTDEDNNNQPIRCDFLGPQGVSTSTVNWAAYLRDSWEVLPNVTLNLGLRYEEQRLRYADHLQGTVDPFTDRPLGKNALVLKNMWAPRLGAVYDWTREGRSKVYAHWGRFFESIPLNLNDRSFGGETLLRQTYDATNQCGATDPGIGGPSGTGCSGPALQDELFGAGFLVAPGIRPQYLDEFVLGVEYEIIDDLRLGATYQNRRLGRVIEDVSVDDTDTFVLANPGEWSEEEERELQAQIDSLPAGDEQRSRLEQELRHYQGVRLFQKPRRDYNALTLYAIKRMSRQFFVQGSYTYSRTMGNYPGLWSPDTGQVNPNISTQFDLIELLANQDGPLPQDLPHYVKVDGFYTWDLEQAGQVITGLRLRALSGSPQDVLGRHHQYGFGESFLLPRGSFGRNPFVVDSDVHLEYRRELQRGMRLSVFTDLFSIFDGQATFLTDENYTGDATNPIVGGEYEDLIWAKRQTLPGGAETADPVRRNRNFRNTIVRYSPFAARIGLRLEF
jgi:hypothetical protein